MTRIGRAFRRLTMILIGIGFVPFLREGAALGGPPRPGLIAPDEYDEATPRRRPLGLSPWKSIPKTAGLPTPPPPSESEQPALPPQIPEPRAFEIWDDGPPVAPPLVEELGPREPGSTADEPLPLPATAPPSAGEGLRPALPPSPSPQAPGLPPAAPSSILAAPPTEGVDPGFSSAADAALCIPDDRQFVKQCLPSGLLYRSYLAGVKEPRFASQLVNESGRGVIWEVALGGRVGIYRNGTVGAVNPEGFQMDLEGAALVRLDMEASQDVDATDYRFGVPFTWRRGPQAWKVAYYHISSHLGDEYMISHPDVERVNYVRESILFGYSYDVLADVRTYAEIGLAFSLGEGAKPLELQFGAEYSPLRESAPFAAINFHLLQDHDFGGNVNVEAGWQWRGMETNHLFRVGAQYYNGKSVQYSFYNRSEQLIGFGMWFDF